MMDSRIWQEVPDLKQIAQRNGHVMDAWRLLGDHSPARSPVQGTTGTGGSHVGGVTCSACGARAVVGTWRPWVETALLGPCKVYTLFREEVRAAGQVLAR